jgi:carbon-monoxide dehydrogenase large subunit
MAGQLHVAFVRSTEAHARIVSIDASAALEREDVEAVFTGADMTDMAAPCVFFWKPPGVDVRVPDHWPLARDKVGYVGQCVAAVIGRDKYSVVDAAEEVLVEYDPLPVVVDPEAALEGASPTVHDEYDTNSVFEWSIGGGDVDAGLADADVVVERRIVNHRTAGAAIEPRGCSPPGRPIASRCTPRRRSRTSRAWCCRSSSASARTASAWSRRRWAAASARSCRSTARRSSPATPRAS